jgi:nitrate/nitrite transport system ATP-binding protein
VLFLDEPFGALDALTRDTLQQDLAQLCAGRDRPVTTVMITNSVEEAILLSDRIVPIVTGPPASLGAPIAVELARPRTSRSSRTTSRPRTRAPTSWRRSPRRFSGGGRSSAAGPNAACPPRQNPPRPRAGIKEKRVRTTGTDGTDQGVRHPTGPFVAVKDVNARILAGTFVAILGHSGCGKSTVLSIVAGLDKATYGGVIIDGHEVTAPGAERAIVFQSPCLLPWLNVLENVMVAATQGATPKSKKEARELARFYLDIVGIGDSEMQMPASSRSARSSACRWRGRSWSSRASCCSTSRSRSSTR